MSLYQEIRYNSPKLKIKENPREIIFEMVSCMCDNRHTLQLKKNKDGDFRIDTLSRGGGFPPALSNFQLKYPAHDIEWAADEKDWDEVIKMINSGVEVIESVKSR